MDARRVVMFSGGIASWGTARRVVERYGPDNLTLLFADTLMEDEDLYRFLDEAAADIGGLLVRVTEGRTPWQVFRDERFIGNSRVDPCSRVLKREPLDRWLKENCDKDTTTVYLGFDWTEMHRWDAAQPRWAAKGWKVEAPLCERPYLGRWELQEELRARGIRLPRLYDMGFPHNNCGGFCIKAGHAQFAKLLAQMPERFAYHEREEEDLRVTLGDVAVLTDRSGGDKRPLPLREFRERTQAGHEVDMFDWGGCGCFDPSSTTDSEQDEE